jgi:hypothetical protein
MDSSTFSVLLIRTVPWLSSIQINVWLDLVKR